MINQQGFHFDSPNFQDNFNIISDGNTYGSYWSTSSCSLRTYLVPVELVNMINQREFNFDSPNFQGSFNIISDGIAYGSYWSTSSTLRAH